MIEPGAQFGRLTALHVSRKLKTDVLCGRRWQLRWTCLCSCGRKVRVRGFSLRNGDTLSCGCLHRERTTKAATKHGGYKTREYGIWRSMLSRCYNPNWPRFADYGGRGITVCVRWRSRGFLCRGFRAFHADMGKRPSRKHSLERINNNLGYSPSNCKWATATEQNNNRRNSLRNRVVTDESETNC